MATQHLPNLHLHSGVRWLTPMMIGLLALILGIIAMLAYPNISA